MHREISDQLKHSAFAVASLLPAAVAPSVVTFAWAGFGIGVARCVTKHYPVISRDVLQCVARTAKLDLFCWTLAGAFCGAFT